MDIPRRTFRWTPGSASESATRSNLGVLLSELVADRAMTSRELVREASRTLLVWLETRPSTWTSNEAALELSSGLGQLCLLYTSPSPRDATLSRMPSSA